MTGPVRSPAWPTPGAAAAYRPRAAEAETQRRLGLPSEMVSDWKARAVEALGERVASHRGLGVWMDACTRCGACTDKCHFYLGTGDPLNMPVARQDLLRTVYRRYHTFWGRWFPRLVGASELDLPMLERWFTYFHQCTQCRRCAVFCPFGIDTAEFSMAGRAILNEIGLGQQFTNDIVDKAVRLGNNLGLPEPALRDTIAGLEAELREETGEEVRIPLDDPGAEILLVVPSADFFADPHVDGLLGIAKIFHQAGLRWTLATGATEAANFALFIGDEPRMRSMAAAIRDSARELGVRRLVIGECGHAWRVASTYLPYLAEGLSFLDPRYPVPQHVIEVTWELLQSGRLRYDRRRNAGRTVTFHDSCNIVRGSALGDRAGDQIALPRRVLRAVCPRYVEMAAGTTGRETFCCGAGAGLLGDDSKALRIRGAAPRLQAYSDVVDTAGVTHIAAMCAICKSQLAGVFPDFGFERAAVLSVHQLVGDALVFTEG